MLIEVWVKPGSKKESCVRPAISGEPWVVAVSAKAVDGEANEAVITALADHLGVKRRYVSIKSGHRSRRKVIQIETDS